MTFGELAERLGATYQMVRRSCIGQYMPPSELITSIKVLTAGHIDANSIHIGCEMWRAGIQVRNPPGRKPSKPRRSQQQ